MLIAALIVGAITAWYFGLRRGLWAAVVAAILCTVALFMPRYAIPIYVGLSVAVVAVIGVGSRRPRPPDALLAVHWLRRRVRKLISGDRDRDAR